MRSSPTVDTHLGLHVVELAGAQLRIAIHHAEPHEHEGIELAFG